MKKGSTLFLKVVLTLIALATLVGLIWLPQTEGRAADLDLISIYLDPFIIYMYIASIPFFAGLYQAFRLLGYIEQDNVFSPTSVNALRIIKYCSLIFIGCIVGAMVYVRMMAKDDDPAGFLAITAVVVFASAVIATAAGVFQRLLQNAVDIKSENDLTV